MKNLVIALTIIAAALFSTPSFAQVAVKAPSDVESLKPGMTLRPLNNSERARLACVKAFNITACSAAVVGTAATVGFVAYSVEVKEAEGKNYTAVADYDKSVKNKFLVGAATSYGICAACAITSVALKATLRNKTIVKASTGGFVIEF